MTDVDVRLRLDRIEYRINQEIAVDLADDIEIDDDTFVTVVLRYQRSLNAPPSPPPVKDKNPKAPEPWGTAKLNPFKFTATAAGVFFIQLTAVCVNKTGGIRYAAYYKGTRPIWVIA